MISDPADEGLSADLDVLSIETSRECRTCGTTASAASLVR